MKRTKKTMVIGFVTKTIGSDMSQLYSFEPQQEKEVYALLNKTDKKQRSKEGLNMPGNN